MEIILKPKPASVFLFLKSQEEAYLSEIAKETGTTYVYITKFISILEQKQLVSIVPKGKKKMVRLSEKGLALATSIEEVRRGSE